MGLNRCVNGHMFSARKYGDTCPYCNTELDKANAKDRRILVDDPDKTMAKTLLEELIICISR